jgi:methyl-accepting chemotaxis protein
MKKPRSDASPVTLSRQEYDALKADAACLARVAHALRSTAIGELECRVIEPEQSRDAHQRIADDFNDTLDQFETFIREAGATLEAASGGQFERQFPTRGVRGVFELGAQRINTAAQVMARADAEVRRLKELARVERQDNDRGTIIKLVAISMLSSEMAVRISQAVTSTSEAQLGTSTMAGAVEQLAASVRDIERSAQSTATTAAAAKEQTDHGHEVISTLRRFVRDSTEGVETMVARTEALRQVATSLRSVVGVISKIAEQTNLLALNATIEAARAGDAGKGFAVVAHEVKALSTQTRKATQTIEERISGLINAFGELTTMMDQSRAHAHEVDGNVGGLEADFTSIADGARGIVDQTTGLATILSQQREAVESLAKNMAALKSSNDRTLEAARTLDDLGQHSLETVEQMRAQYAGADVPRRDVYLARADHLLWKSKIMDFVQGRPTGLSDLVSHQECRLGKWVAGQQSSALLRRLEGPHERVHRSGRAAAEAFLAHSTEAGWEHFRQLETASAEVLEVLDAILAAPEGS